MSEPGALADVVASTGLPRTVHLVGLAGGGLAPLARLLGAEGHRLSGSDTSLGFDPAAWRARGVAAHRGHDAEHLADADLVVRSAAVPEGNPELRAARARGVPVLKYSEALGRLMASRTGVAIAGTHGKTTTTALVAHLLERSGSCPGWIVGGQPLGLADAAWGPGPFVAEACEYDRSFLNLSHDVGVVLGVSADHLDCFGDAAAVVAAFQDFTAATAPGGVIVRGEGVPADVGLPVPEGCEVLVVGRDLELVEIREDADGFTGLVAVPGETPRPFRFGLVGRHNLGNLAAALLAVRAAGVPLERAVAHVAGFAGVARRLQDLGECALPGGGTARVIDDFAHHPEALAAAEQGLRPRFGGRRLVAVFQPHQVSRTADFLPRFAESLSAFDRVLLCDIFVARDVHPERAPQLLAELASALGPRARVVGPARDALAAVAEELRPRDVCVVMGAGDIDGLAGRLAGATARPAS